MKQPIIKPEYCTAGWIASLCVALLCLLMRIFQWPGSEYAASVFLIVTASILFLYSGENNKATIRYGILVFAVGTGILLMCQRYESFIDRIQTDTALLKVSPELGVLSGLLWLIPVLTSLRLAGRISSNIYLRSLVGGALVLVPSMFMMLSCDFLKLFIWYHNFMPVKACLLWFIGGFFFHFTALQMGVEHSNTIATRLYFTYLGFFTAAFTVSWIMYTQL